MGLFFHQNTDSLISGVFDGVLGGRDYLTHSSLELSRQPDELSPIHNPYQYQHGHRNERCPENFLDLLILPECFNN